ncbi:ATP phosphoribosyltransferase [Candidatus Vidania fulgoroideorum]
MKIAVPKGRILNLFIKYLKKNKIKLINYNSRKMIIETSIKKLLIVPIKYLDTEFYLENNYVDCCISGNDIYEENFKKNNKILKKKISLFKCNLFLITRHGYKLDNFYNKKKILVYTKYLKIVKKIFNRKKYKIKKLNGNLELTLFLKISNYIVDIVDTGKTLAENNLVKLKKVKKIYSILLFKKKIKKSVKKMLKKIFFI